MTRRLEILEAVLERLAAIDGTGAFETSAGSNVHLGVARLTPDDDPLAIVVAVRSTETRVVSDLKNIVLALDIQALALADMDTPGLNIEKLIGDIKRAMELPDRTLGKLAIHLEPGEVDAMPRESGGTVIGASVGYTIRMHETFGAP